MDKLPSTMKAIMVSAPGGSLVEREVPVPVPGKNEVLVKIAAAPVNPSDIARLKRGLFDASSYIPGLEGSGIVVGSGSGLLPYMMLGKRVACSSEYPESGTWAEYMVTKAGKCYPLGSKIGYIQGSMLMINPLTALAFIDIAKNGRHQALINNAAASALGRMIELLGNIHGIPVINIVRSEQNLAALKNSGSVYVLNSSSKSFTEDLSKLSHDLRATLFFDSTCSYELNTIFEVLPYGSRVIIYGNLAGEDFFPVNPRYLIDKDIKITGFFLGHQVRSNGLLKNILNLRKIGKLMSNNLKIKVRASYPLERAQEAIDSYLAGMTEGKAILVPDLRNLKVIPDMKNFRI